MASRHWRNFPQPGSIDAGVPATVSLGKERIAVEMLPRTAMLVHRDAAKDWSSVLRTAAPARCHLEVQALFSTDAFRLLMFAGRASGEVEIHTGPDTALRDTHYQLAGMGLVPGRNGRSVKEPGDRCHPHLWRAETTAAGPESRCHGLRYGPGPHERPGPGGSSHAVHISRP